MIKGDSR